MKRPVRFHVHLVAAGMLAVAAAACTEGELHEGEGTLRVGLWGGAASGETYSLRDASFRITGVDFDLTIDTNDLPDGTAVSSTPLARGEYQLELEEGWTVYRGDVGDPMPVQVVATLASDNPLPVMIEDGLATEATYMFEVEGELVEMSEGTLDIDVDFSEDDGICTETHYWTEIESSFGDDAGEGDGWQALTVPRDSVLHLIGMGWNAADPDGFTINIYEGIGTSGTLLHSEFYPDHANYTVPGWDWHAPALPLLLEGGRVYTVEGVGTSGWMTSIGPWPGGTSSLGNTRHKNVQFWGAFCE